MFNLELEQLDVKTAFLNEELDEVIYMCQPEGFVVEGKEDHVCLLKRSVYGLKQASRQWYKQFDSFMLSCDFFRSRYANCVYFRKLPDGSFIYVLIYVDDIFIAAKDMFEFDRLKSDLNGEFEMKDLRVAKILGMEILGMEIRMDRKVRKVFLSQKSFIKKVLFLLWYVRCQTC
ncbi:hypothetical protein Dimus_038440 [Dionaea muscipula]